MKHFRLKDRIQKKVISGFVYKCVDYAINSYCKNGRAYPKLKIEGKQS